MIDDDVNDAFSDLTVKYIDDSEDASHIEVSDTEEAFDDLIPPEVDSTFQTVLRSAYQVAAGLAKTLTWPADAILMLTQGDDREMMSQLKEDERTLGIPFDEASFKEGSDQAREQIEKYFPTQENIEKLVEEKTGLPLQPKNKAQKDIRLGAEAFGFSPSGIVRKVGGALAAPAISEALQLTGMSEESANLVGLSIGSAGPEVAKAISKRLKSTNAGQQLARHFESRTPTGLERTARDSIYGGDPPGGDGSKLPRDLSIEPPKSTLKNRERAANILEEAENAEFSREAQQEKPLSGIRPSDTARAETDSSSLSGRVTTRTPEELGVRPTRVPTQPAKDLNLKDSRRVSQLVHPNKIVNKQLAGISYDTIINEISAADYAEVNRLYDRSRAFNNQIVDIHPELFEILDEQAENIRRIPRRARSTVQRKKLGAIDDILGKIAKTDADGQIIEYLGVNSQDLIETQQSLRQLVDFDFAAGKPSGAFKPTIQALSEAVEASAVSQGNESAVKAIREARAARREWAITFDTDEVNVFRDKSNREYIKNFNKAKDVDTLDHLTPIVERHPNGKELINATRRELVDEKLSQFFDQPRGRGRADDFEDALREIELVITQEQADTLRQEFQTLNSAPEARKIKNLETKAAKTIKVNPDQISSEMKTPTGVKELRTKLSRTPDGKAVFNELADAKLKEIFKSGRIKQSPTGKEIFDILDNQKTFELVAELTSEEAATALLERAEKLGTERFPQLTKLGKRAVELTILRKILPRYTLR